MTVHLVNELDATSITDPSNYQVFFSEKNQRNIKDNFLPREQAPIGKPGKSCENNLFLGFFFDGTRNNYALSEEAKGRNTHSNVARLFDAYPGKPFAPLRVLGKGVAWDDEAQYPNYFRIYTPGVGTPFEEVNDTGEQGTPVLTDGGSGAAFARWGERRLIWALSQAINAVHLYFKKETLLKPQDIKELMSKLTLDGRQLKAAPLYVDLGRAATTKAHLEQLLVRLHQSIKSHMPKAVTGQDPKVDPGIVKHIYVSAFGFSRGAAAARAYTNWFLALCELDAKLNKTTGYTLGGFPVTFDFLGIFDTVASVGAASITPGKHGHDAWADAERSLRVPPDVKCFHLVSGHEVRRCFPLDSISINGAMAAGHREVVMPGVHSDVGGGYAPTEQGRGSDPEGADMLSRIALALMYKEARLNGAPLKLERARTLTKGRFKVNPSVIHALNDYLSMCPVKEGNLQAIMHDQTRLYLLWRKDCMGRLASMPSVKKADQVDQNDLISADQEFQDEVAVFERWMRQPMVSAPQEYCPKPEMGICVDVEVLRHNLPALSGPGVDEERLKEWEEIKGFWQQGKVAPQVAHLFMHHVHDSRAWFKLLGTEAADVEAQLKQWVRAYEAIIKQQLNPQNRFSANEIEWIKQYKATGKIPAMKTSGREPFELGAGFLRFRRIYSGADAWAQPVAQAAQQGGITEVVGSAYNSAKRSIQEYFGPEQTKQRQYALEAQEFGRTQVRW
jgi:hypothetical protein